MPETVWDTWGYESLDHEGVLCIPLVCVLSRQTLENSVAVGASTPAPVEEAIRHRSTYRPTVSASGASRDALGGGND